VQRRACSFLLNGEGGEGSRLFGVLVMQKGGGRAVCVYWVFSFRAICLRIGKPGPVASGYLGKRRGGRDDLHFLKAFGQLLRTDQWRRDVL